MSLHIFSLRCSALAGAQQGGVGKGEKTPTEKEGGKKTQRGAENRLPPVPQNTNDAKDDCASLQLELHSARARVQLPKWLSMRHTEDHELPSPARKVDLSPGLRIEEHPSTPVPLFSLSRGSTLLACSCHGEELKLQPASLHKRHQQQSPATETAPEESRGVRGACLLHTYQIWAGAWHPKEAWRAGTDPQNPGQEIVLPSKEAAGDRAGGIWVPTNLLPARTGGSGQEREGEVVCSNRWPLR